MANGNLSAGGWGGTGGMETGGPRMGFGEQILDTGTFGLYGKGKGWWDAAGEEDARAKAEAADRARRFQEMGGALGGYQIPGSLTQGLDRSNAFNFDLMQGRNSVAAAQAKALLDRQNNAMQSQAMLGQGGAALAARNARQGYGQAAANTTQQALAAGLAERQAAAQQYLKGQALGIGSELNAQGLRQQGMLGAGGLEVQNRGVEVQGAGIPTEQEKMMNMGMQGLGMLGGVL